jgi:hypothetical protein
MFPSILSKKLLSNPLTAWALLNVFPASSSSKNVAAWAGILMNQKLIPVRVVAMDIFR